MTDRAMTAARQVRALESRAGWVRDKVGREDGSPGALGFLNAELLALDFAIAVLHDLAEREADDPRNMIRRRWEQQWQTTAVKALWELAQHDPERAERLLAKAPDGARTMYDREHEQRTYGAAVPRADDTRKHG